MVCKGRVPRPKPMLTKKNIKARLSFVKKHLDENQDFGGKVGRGLTKQKLNFLEGVCPVTSGVTQHFRKNIIPAVKYGGGSVMIWGYFVASGPG